MCHLPSLVCSFCFQFWDGESFDHRLTIAAHINTVTYITSFFSSPPTQRTGVVPTLRVGAAANNKAFISKGTVIFSAASDGTIRVSSCHGSRIPSW